MIRFASILTLITGASAAFGQSFPALYDVSRLQPGDHLDVYAIPNEGSQLIGRLPGDLKNIEVVQLDLQRFWARLNLEEKSGWVQLTHMRRQPDQDAAQFPAFLHCFGTEPFWSLTLDDTPRFISPDGEKVVSVAVKQGALGNIDHLGFVGAFPDDQTSLTGIVSRGVCTDGMSDRQYGLSLDLVESDGKDMVLLNGCCSLTGN